ncbi:MAG: DUF1223 domain-containing protein [Hyphomonadaceae bacterium]
MSRLLATLLLCVCAFVPAAAAQERTPIVVELYTSQGCDSCPRANRLMGRVAQEDGVLALTFPVDYWDYLGWRDTFAQPAFTARQRAYVQALRARSLFTPQLVYNGIATEPGARPERLREMIDQMRTDAPDDGPDIDLRMQRHGLRVAVGRGPAQRLAADIWVVSFDPGPVYADVDAGENAGVRVPHYNLVERIARLGGWNGQPVSFSRTRCQPTCAVLVQAPHGGPVLAAARLAPAPPTPPEEVASTP